MWIRMCLSVMLLGCSSMNSTDRTAFPEEQLSEMMEDALARESGVALEDRKIIGGREALPGENPWQVALLVARNLEPRRTVFCGGSIIDPNWVITAAHCVNRATPNAVDVLAGTINLDSGGQRVAVTDIIIRPDYRRAREGDDIALLRLATPIRDAEPIAMIASGESELERAEVDVRTTGWGAVRPGGSTVRLLRSVETIIQSDTRCNDPVSYSGAITREMICAGRVRGGEDSCQGDSGGPLSTLSNQRRVLIGIVSWGEGCGRRNKFGVYTRLSQYTDWVSACLAGAPACIRRQI